MAISTSHLFVFVFLSITVTFAPSTFATDYIVGDSVGWNNTGVNYTEWAQGKTFYVGDTLIFNYKVGEHNVYKVNGVQFKNCTIPTDQKPMSSGNDIVKLATVGRKWYICGIGSHCSEQKQKFVITVMDMAPANSPMPGGATPPPPPSAATKPAVSAQFGFVAVVVGILGMMMA